MSMHTPIVHDIPHSPPAGRPDAAVPGQQAIILQARLSEIARRDPASVLRVLGDWLGASAAGPDGSGPAASDSGEPEQH